MPVHPLRLSAWALDSGGSSINIVGVSTADSHWQKIMLIINVFIEVYVNFFLLIESFNSGLSFSFFSPSSILIYLSFFSWHFLTNFLLELVVDKICVPEIIDEKLEKISVLLNFA